MSKQRESRFTPTPQTFAAEALRTVGNVNETTGYFWHEIQAVGYFDLAPSFIFDNLSIQMAKTTKEKILRKAEKVD
jgi:hypothetical protein